jgi:hypothetical protein
MDEPAPSAEVTADPSTDSTSSGRRRRWILPVALLATLAVGVGGTLAAVQLTKDDEATVSTSGGSDETSDTVAEIALPATRYAFAEAPADMELSWISDPDREDQGGMGDQPYGSLVLLAGADATYSKGPWVTVMARGLAEWERGSELMSSLPFDTSTAKTVKIGGTYDGKLGTSWDGSTVLGFGPVDEDYVVLMSAEGLSDQQLVEVASGVQLADGEPRLDPSVLPMEMDVLAKADGVWDSAPTAFINSARSISLNYAAAAQTPDSAYVSLQYWVQRNDDVLSLATFMLDDAEEITVHGKPAVLGTPSQNFGGGFDSRTVVWSEDDNTFVLSVNNGDELDPAALAESVVPADSAEWDDLYAEMQARQKEQEEFYNNPPDSWLIAAGDLDSSTTWAIEGGLMDAERGGGFIISTSEMSANSSGMSGGFDPVNALTEFPTVLVRDDGMESTTIVALGPLDPAGSILRVTLDDGQVIELPLRTIRPEWPASAAAVAVSAERSGTAELLGADGTVLATGELTGRVVQDFGSETTAVAIGG